MANDYNDPTFRRNQSQTQVAKTQPMREYVVGATEEDYAYPTPIPGTQVTPPQPLSEDELEQRLAQVKRDRLSGVSRISDQAKKRIELLTNIGRLNRDVTLEGFIFSLRTLKAKETREASMAILGCVTQLEAGFESRRQQLARSIYQIDNREVALVLGSDNLETKLEFIDDLEESILTKLFDEFAALKQEAQKKYSINTTDEAKEVAEDLKK